MNNKKEKLLCTQYKNKNSRFKKEGFQIVKNGVFNTYFIPWGFNWVLGYCEQSSNFEKR